jgi:hypothetical protein
MQHTRQTGRRLAGRCHKYFIVWFGLPAEPRFNTILRGIKTEAIDWPPL